MKNSAFLRPFEQSLLLLGMQFEGQYSLQLPRIQHDGLSLEENDFAADARAARRTPRLGETERRPRTPLTTAAPSPGRRRLSACLPVASRTEVAARSSGRRREKRQWRQPGGGERRLVVCKGGSHGVREALLLLLLIPQRERLLLRILAFAGDSPEVGAGQPRENAFLVPLFAALGARLAARRGAAARHVPWPELQEAKDACRVTAPPPISLRANALCQREPPRVDAASQRREAARRGGCCTVAASF